MKDQNDKGAHKSRNFLKSPEFPGGNTAFREFVSQNLCYPEKALDNQIQGAVYLEYHVDNVGKTSDIVVKRSLGYGCDEEAIRLVKMIRYPAMRNRGVKMKTLMKTQIEFRLPAKKVMPQSEFNYMYSITPKAAKKEAAKTPKVAYNYTINI